MMKNKKQASKQARKKDNVCSSKASCTFRTRWLRFYTKTHSIQFSLSLFFCFFFFFHVHIVKLSQAMDFFVSTIFFAYSFNEFVFMVWTIWCVNISGSVKYHAESHLIFSLFHIYWTLQSSLAQILCHHMFDHFNANSINENGCSSRFYRVDFYEWFSPRIRIHESVSIVLGHGWVDV